MLLIIKHAKCILIFPRGRPAHLAHDNVDAEVVADSQSDDEPIVVVQLSNRVQDGTRCRMGSLDMCIQGKCQVNTNNKQNPYRVYHLSLKIFYLQYSKKYKLLSTYGVHLKHLHIHMQSADALHI